MKTTVRPQTVCITHLQKRDQCKALLLPLDRTVYDLRLKLPSRSRDYSDSFWEPMRIPQGSGSRTELFCAVTRQVTGLVSIALKMTEAGPAPRCWQPGHSM